MEQGSLHEVIMPRNNQSAGRIEATLCFRLAILCNCAGISKCLDHVHMTAFLICSAKVMNHKILHNCTLVASIDERWDGKGLHILSAKVSFEFA